MTKPAVADKGKEKDAKVEKSETTSAEAVSEPASEKVGKTETSPTITPSKKEETSPTTNTNPASKEEDTDKPKDEEAKIGGTDDPKKKVGEVEEVKNADDAKKEEEKKTPPTSLEGNPPSAEKKEEEEPVVKETSKEEENDVKMTSMSSGSKEEEDKKTSGPEVDKDVNMDPKVDRGPKEDGSKSAGRVEMAKKGEVVKSPPTPQRASPEKFEDEGEEEVADYGDENDEDSPRPPTPEVEEATDDATQAKDDEEEPPEVPDTVMVSLSDDEEEADVVMEEKKIEVKKDEYEDDIEDGIRREYVKKFELCSEDVSVHSFLGANNRSMSSLCCEGFQYLLCTARTNVGFIGGRHLFELRWIEKARSSGIVKIGVSLTGEPSVCPNAQMMMFSSCGNLFTGHNGSILDISFTDSKYSSVFDRTHVVSVVLDLENISTASLSIFIDGKRSSPMVDLPEVMKEAVRDGKGIFPAVCTKSASVALNFGPTAISELPFKPRMVNQAFLAHTVVNPFSLERPEVLFVAQFPEHESSFAIPEGYIEISDRALISWAEASGNPRSDAGFGIKSLDDSESLKKQFLSKAAECKRKLCIIANVLNPEVRKELRKEFTEHRTKILVRILDPSEDCKNIPKDYLSYSVPTPDEGFDEIEFESSDSTNSHAQATAIIGEYQKRNKLNEKLEPTISSSFRETIDAFRLQVAEWKKSHKALENIPEPDDEERDMMEADIDTGGQGDFPIYAYFAPDDWVLLDIRFELLCLLQTFRQDTNRDGFHFKHLEHYFSHYYRKSFKVTSYGCTSLEEMLEMMIPDIVINEKLLQAAPDSQDPITPEHMLRLVEVERKDRSFRIDAGDETAKLKFSITRLQESSNVQRIVFSGVPEPPRKQRSRSRGERRDRSDPQGGRKRSRSRRRSREKRERSEKAARRRSRSRRRY